MASPNQSNSNKSNLNSSNNARPLKLRRVNHTDEIVFGFSNLLRNESMTDVTLICNGGQTIRAHRVILSTFSPYFKTIFESQPFSNNPCQYPVIVIKDLELNELKTIIDFIYKGEVSVSRDKLQSVLQAAKALEVSGLADLKFEAFNVNNNSNNNSNNNLSLSTNNINTLLANSLMNSPNTSNNSNNLNDLDQLNFGSLSALNYVCNLNGKKLNSNLDTDLLNEQQLKKLRVSIEDSNDLLNSLGTSLLGDNIDEVRSLLQQPPRSMPQSLQSKQQNQQLNQLSQYQQQLQLQKQKQQQFIKFGAAQQCNQQMQLLQKQKQLQQLQMQQRLQNQQIQQKIMQLNQNGNLKNKYSAPKNNNTLQGTQFAQFQEKIKQQIQEKQQQQKSNENGKLNDDKSANNKKDQEQDDDCGSVCIEQENNEKSNQKDDQEANDLNKDDQENGDLLVDDENNNQIDKLNDEPENSRQQDDLENGNNGFVDFDENADNQLNDEEEYEIDIDKDVVFQRQQIQRLEQLQKQQHFQNFQLMQIDDSENRNIDFQQLATLAQVGLTRNGDLADLNGRRNSSKDSLLQTSSASGSEDTDNDNNTMDINDNLSIMENNFFDDYNNLASGSPIPMQVKLDPQLNRIPQTPDFLLPRGPGRPRKGNKGSDISPCPECHKKFVRPDVLKLHYRSVHLNERHPCNMCPKIFKWPGDLSKHKRTKHSAALLNQSQAEQIRTN